MKKPERRTERKPLRSKARLKTRTRIADAKNSVEPVSLKASRISDRTETIPIESSATEKKWETSSSRLTESTLTRHRIRPNVITRMWTAIQKPEAASLGK